MVNLLGDLWFADAGATAPREPDWTRVLRHPQAKLHLYGKAEPRRGRKMGHVTCLGADARRGARDRARDQARPRHSRRRRALSAALADDARDRDAGPLAGLRVLDLTRLLPGPGLHALPRRPRRRRRQGRGHRRRRLRAQPRQPAGNGLGVLPRGQPQQAQRRARPQGSARPRRVPRARASAPTSIVESFRPGVVAALGVDYDADRARSIRASSTRRSPATARTARARSSPGHDINYLGYAGVLDQTGARGGPPALSQPADRRPARRRGVRGDRDPRRARRRAAHRPRPLRRRRDGRRVARAQHLRAARARAVGARAAARRGPADRRRALLRRLSDAGRALARRRRARGQVLAARCARRSSARSRRRPVRAGRRRRARARASSSAIFAARAARGTGPSGSPASTAA